jgi:hypothetical protein
MSTDKAIRVGQKLPKNYKKMAQSACNCGATYSIIHEEPFAETKRALKQVAHLKSILSDEHVDEKHRVHLTSYDLDE